MSICVPVQELEYAGALKKTFRYGRDFLSEVAAFEYVLRVRLASVGDGVLQNVKYAHMYGVRCRRAPLRPGGGDADEKLDHLSGPDGSSAMYNKDTVEVFLCELGERLRRDYSLYAGELSKAPENLVRRKFCVSSPDQFMRLLDEELRYHQEGRIKRSLGQRSLIEYRRDLGYAA